MRRSVAGYTRISRVGGRKGEGFISETVQREGCLSRASELGLAIEEWFHDPDYTGGNLQRPEWERLMARILDDRDPLCGVVVVRVDRFARTVPEGAPEVKRIWDSNGGHGVFVAADLPIDTTTPHGRKMLWDWLANAELFLEMRKVEWWNVKQRAIGRGAHIGRTPLQFSRIPKDAQKDGGKLVPKPEWVPVSLAIFEYAARDPDMRSAAISRWANEHAKRPDGRSWTPTGIDNMLRNRVLVGEVAYRPARGARRRTNHDFEPMVNPDAHEGIVPLDLFLAAQRSKRRPPRSTARSNSKRMYLLQGLVRCAGCRHSLVPSRAGRNIAVYRCDGESSAGKCPSRATISAHIIEPWVIAQVQEQLGEFEAVGEFVPEADDAAERLAQIESERHRAHNELARITENTALAAADPDGWLAVRRAAVENATEWDERYVAEIQAQRSPVPAVVGRSFSWDDVEPEELRDVILPAFIDCVFVRSGRGVAVDRRSLILWRGQADDDLPGKGRPAPAVRSFEWPEDEPLAGVARGEHP